MPVWICVGLGGFVGAVCRYFMGRLPLPVLPADFPLTTLLINLLGAVAIGGIVALSETAAIGPSWAAFLKTGVCGGFTTFSTFSLETWKLLEKGKWGAGGIYAALSVTLCIAGVWLGLTAVRMLSRGGTT